MNFRRRRQLLLAAGEQENRAAILQRDLHALEAHPMLDSCSAMRLQSVPTFTLKK
ncbi:MAG: hypothetical protein NT123_14200 [Proteobacteria bacterium]|nr:hypothetical protein [Pseudomonadota bacterium]